jgi:hypothetical protein
MAQRYPSLFLLNYIESYSMSEAPWVAHLMEAVAGARMLGVGDEYVRWRLDRMLSDGKRREKAITLAGTVEVVVNCDDESAQPAISVCVPIRHPRPKAPE